MVDGCMDIMIWMVIRVLGEKKDYVGVYGYVCGFLSHHVKNIFIFIVLRTCGLETLVLCVNGCIYHVF